MGEVPKLERVIILIPNDIIRRDIPKIIYLLNSSFLLLLPLLLLFADVFGLLVVIVCFSSIKILLIVSAAKIFHYICS